MQIAVDFGGTNIKVGLVRDGNVFAMESLPAHSDQGLGARLGMVQASVQRLLLQSDLTLRGADGIGIAMPGIVDTERKTVLSINEKYSDAVGFAFEQWCESAFGLPVVMENDARAALLGEVSYGAAAGSQDAVLVTFGTGIGTAAIMNGKVVRGRHAQGGILGGHLIANAEGAACTCGNIGCVEAMSSHWAITGLATAHPDFAHSLLRQGKLDYKAVLDAEAAGDRTASEVLRRLLVYWSAAVINMIHAYDPETVVLSGGLMKSANKLLPHIERRVRELAWTPWGQIRFVLARDPDQSVLLGLAHLLDGSH